MSDEEQEQEQKQQQDDETPQAAQEEQGSQIPEEEADKKEETETSASEDAEPNEQASAEESESDHDDEREEKGGDEEEEEPEAQDHGDDHEDQEQDDEEAPPEVTDRQQEEAPDQQHDGEGEFEESVVHVNRCCKVVQGGKKFSFSALVVAGNRNGKISYGFGKANQVPQAIQKAIQESRDRMIEVPIVHGTIPHRVELEYCSTELLLRPASPGTGVIASLPVRTTVNLAGITDLLTKIYGSTNPINCVKAVYEGLKSLRTKEEIEELRDVKIT